MLLRALGLAFLFGAAAQLDPSAPWPAVAHDAAHSGAAGLNGPASGSLRWAFQTGVLGKSKYQPLIGSDGSIYSTVYTRIFSLSPAGSLRWLTDVGQTFSGSGLLRADGIFVVASDTGVVYAVSMADGSVQWNTTLPGGVNGFASVRSSIGMGPTGRILVPGTQNGFAAVFCLSPSGSMLWNYTDTRNGPVPAPLFVATTGLVYVYSGQGNVLALDAVTGRLVWSVQPGGFFTGYLSSSADGSMVYGGTDMGGTGSLDDDDAGAGAGLLYALDAATGTVQWKFVVGAAIIGGPAVLPATGSIAISAGASLAVVSAAGGLVWRMQQPYTLETAPTWGADGTVYVGDSVGQLVALSGVGGFELFAFSQGRPDSDLGIVTAPAIGGDGSLVYADTPGSLVCLAGPAPIPSYSPIPITDDDDDAGGGGGSPAPSGLSPGSQAGVAIASIAALGLAGGAVWWRRRRTGHYAAHHASGVSSSTFVDDTQVSVREERSFMLY